MTEPFDAPDEKVKVHKVACAVCMRDFEAHDTKHLQAAFSQHMTDGTCRSRGSSDDTAREQSMRETAAEFELPPQWRDVEIEVGREPGRDAVWVGHPTEDGLEALIPTSQLPRVVRELAALMTPQDRDALCTEIAGDIMNAGILHFTQPRYSATFTLKPDESGPGISALPVKSEALLFTLEDLLCEDA